jgi:hypothetical protein
MRRLPAHERLQMVRDGLLDRHAVICEACGRNIEPGQLAMCNDGYSRVYGEFVLVDPDDLHEDNHPHSHAECAPE